MTVTTPEQVLADPAWRRRHSVYTLWALFFGLGFLSFFYIGVRAKKHSWTIWGALYAAIVLGALVMASLLTPENPDAPRPWTASLANTVFMLAWVISAIHVFVTRKQWLRWKASEVTKPKWYETTSSSASERADDHSNVDLSPLGIDDPTSAYLAPTPPPRAPASPPPAAPAPPPPPAAPPPQPTRHSVPPSATTPTAASSDGHEPIAADDPSSGLVDLNTASTNVLAALPGVGVATATRLVNERDRRGGFSSVDEAAVAVNVQPHVRARLREMAVVSEPDQKNRPGPSGRVVDI